MWIRRLAGAASKVTEGTSRITAIIATVFLVAMVLLTVVDVFLRSVFRAPILGSVELTEYMMVLAGFLGMAWCAQKGGHVIVGILVDRLPARVQAAIDSITLFLSLALVPLVVWQSIAQSLFSLSEDYTSDILKIPESPFYMVVAIGYAVMFFVILATFINTVKKAAGK